MKNLSLVLSFFPLFAQANLGFNCPSEKLEIHRQKVQEIMTLVVKNTADGTEHSNPQLILPMENTVDAYQERFGLYYETMTNAQMAFPYMPEAAMYYHMSRSTTLYKKGFKAFEGEGPVVELPKMYCKAFADAIKNF